MNLRPVRRKPPDIMLTPMLDVLLVLLIFFMVSTNFKDETRLRVQLPQAQGQEAPERDPELIRIVIDRSGTFFVDDREVIDRRKVGLVRALTAALGERRDLPVLVQADAATPHQAVMTALDASADLGLVKIAFGASRPAEEGGAAPPEGASRGTPPVAAPTSSERLAIPVRPGPAKSPTVPAGPSGVPR